MGGGAAAWEPPLDPPLYMFTIKVNSKVKMHMNLVIRRENAHFTLTYTYLSL
jgi:hypothetical protein